MFVYSWNYLITYLFACLLIYSFTDLFIYWLFNCLFIYWFIYLLAYLFAD